MIVFSWSRERCDKKMCFINKLRTDDLMEWQLMQYSPTFTEGIIILFLVNTTKLYVRYVLGFGLYNSFSAFNFPTNFYVKIWGNIDRSYDLHVIVSFEVLCPVTVLLLKWFRTFRYVLAFGDRMLDPCTFSRRGHLTDKKKKKTYENLVHMQWYSWS